MHRLFWILILSLALLSLVPRRAGAQAGPLAPAAIDPRVSSAITQAALAAGYDYAGDCQPVGIESSSRVCSLVFPQDDGSASVGFFTIADDGTAVQPAFYTLSVPASSGLALIQVVSPGNAPPGALGNARTDQWSYLFRIAGPPINGPIGGSDGRGVTLSPAVPFLWGRTSDTNIIYVSIAPSAPSGTYTLQVALANGDAVTATFAHPGSGPTDGPPTTSTPASSVTLPSSRLGPGTVTYDFGVGVSAADQDVVRASINLGQQTFGQVGDLSVQIYADINALLPAYAQAVCNGCVLDDTTRQRWLGGGEGEAFLGHIFYYTGLPSWQNGSRAQQIHGLVHEYFHTYQNAAYGQQIVVTSPNGPYAAGPVWLIEGSAEYEAYRATDAGGVESFAAGITLHASIARRITLALPATVTWEQPRTTGQTDAPYSLGFFAVRQLASLAGEDSVKQYWSTVRTAQRWQDAFTTVFGLTPEDFYSRYPDYLAAQIALPPPSLQFVGALPPGSVNGFPATGALYAFTIGGVDATLGAGSVQVTASSGAVVSKSWGRLSADRIVVYLSPGTPGGAYTVTVTLPNGGLLQAAFQHTGA
jgi:hypothetical protein